MPKISVTVLTKNSQKYLPEVLAALQSFDEVVICDTGSTDNTIEIAKQFHNVVVYSKPFIGFGPTHNIASSLASYDWILSIDSDEIVTPEMVKEIENTPLEGFSVYSFPRNNYYNGKWIRWCGWHPDRQIRLYHRKHTKFTDAQVHEGIIVTGMKLVQMKQAMIHYSYDNISDFLAKMQSYSDLFAKQNQNRKSSSLIKAISHGFYAFLKSYFLKKGFLGGQEGFEISIYNANTAFYKYIKLAELNRKSQQCPVLNEKDGDDPKKKPSL